MTCNDSWVFSVIFQLLDELSRELDELRKYKLLSDTQRNSLQASIQSTNIETNGMKKRDLEMHCINLKQVQ